MREALGRGAGIGAEASESGIGLSSLLVGGAPQHEGRPAAPSPHRLHRRRFPDKGA